MSTATLSRTNIAARLLELPREIETAEILLAEANQVLFDAKAALEYREATLLLRGIEGKNEAERKARVLVETLNDQEHVRAAQEQATGAAIRLRTVQAEFSSLRAVSRLLGGESD